MQVAIVHGIGVNEQAEFELEYPLNLEPIIIDSNISKGQLRTAAGTKPFAAGPDIDRGAITWNDLLYRVMGSKLVKVASDATVTVIGDVGGSGPVSLDYSFDKLIIRSDRNLFYYDDMTLSQVTDTDLGQVVDAMWIDGYTMSTDGKFVLVTELTDPFQVKPTKYGSAEDDPDDITGLIRCRGEAYVLGRNSIQVFQNAGGSGFPFQTVDGATIPTGCVSASAKCLFGETFAFVGSGRGNALGVHVAGQGSANKISTRSVDDALAAVADATAIELERRVSRDELRLYVHLPHETWVFLAKASQAAGEPIWYRCQSGVGKAYRLRHAALAYGKMLVGDTESGAIAETTTEADSHFGETTQHQFDAGLIYNAAKGAVIDAVELVGNPGRGDDALGSTIFLSFTRDGVTFSPERAKSLGRTGDRTKRVQWRPHVRVHSYMGMRFRFFSRALAGIAACEVTARPLNV